MSAKGPLGFRGIRSVPWAKSKRTNQTIFDPGDIEIGQVISKHYDKIYDKRSLTIIEQPTHPAFLMPMDKASVRKALKAVPKRFTLGLTAVILLSGSRKQEKAFKGNFAFGRYSEGVIFIHPFPKKFMDLEYDFALKPSVLADYKRAGASVVLKGKSCCIRFTKKALARFYLRDVLLHELGHHVDAKNFSFKTDKKAEGFADWFASEHGYRLRAQGKPAD